VDGWVDAQENLLSREAVQYLISPDMLLEAIGEYHTQVADDPNAPQALVELLDHFVPYGQRVGIWTHSEVALGEDEDDYEDEDEDLDP